MDYLWHLATIAGLYVVLAVSLDLVAGRAGLVSLAHAAFYGTGAYVTGLLASTVHWPFCLALVAAAAASAALSLLVSLSSLRLKGDFFVIATFGLQMIVLGVMTNWTEVTGGPTGFPGIPRPQLLGFTIGAGAPFAVVSWVIAGLVVLGSRNIAKSPFGRAFHAIREDELFAESLGKPTLSLKIRAVAVSSALAGLAGGLFAYYMTFIAPAHFGVGESILLLTMVVLGGAGSTWGPVVGAVLLLLVPEVLRFIGLPGPVAGNLRQMIYGAVLVVIVLLRPRGLVGQYEFGR